MTSTKPTMRRPRVRGRVNCWSPDEDKKARSRESSDINHQASLASKTAFFLTRCGGLLIAAHCFQSLKYPSSSSGSRFANKRRRIAGHPWNCAPARETSHPGLTSPSRTISDSSKTTLALSGPSWSSTSDNEWQEASFFWSLDNVRLRRPEYACSSANVVRGRQPGSRTIDAFRERQMAACHASRR